MTFRRIIWVTFALPCLLTELLPIFVTRGENEPAPDGYIAGFANKIRAAELELVVTKTRQILHSTARFQKDLPS